VLPEKSTGATVAPLMVTVSGNPDMLVVARRISLNGDQQVTRQSGNI
jgi:hypothetical protein